MFGGTFGISCELELAQSRMGGRLAAVLYLSVRSESITNILNFLKFLMANGPTPDLPRPSYPLLNLLLPDRSSLSHPLLNRGQHTLSGLSRSSQRRSSFNLRNGRWSCTCRGENLDQGENARGGEEGRGEMQFFGIAGEPEGAVRRDATREED